MEEKFRYWLQIGNEIGELIPADIPCLVSLEDIRGGTGKEEIMFEVIVKLKNDFMDLSGVPDVELFKALSDWSSGKEEIINIKGFKFKSEDILHIRINR